MSSKPRERSEADIYHIYARGSGRQIIYEDDSDKRAFLHFLEEQMLEQPCHLYAYCLMSNHYHLVIKIEFEHLARFMHGVNWKYARYHNLCHGTTGHLFDGRYGSQAIHGDEQLLQAIRYVHRNPVEASMCPTCNYPWSSYGDYLESSGITSTGFVLEMLGSRSAFEEFHRHAGKESFIDDVVPCARMDIESARGRACNLLAGMNPHELKALDKRERDEYLSLLRANGLTASQIALITGISQSTVSRATANQ